MDLSLLMAITKEIVGTHQLQDLPWKVVEEVGLRLGIPYTGFALATRKGELVFSAAHGGRADHRALLSDGSRTALLPAGQGIAGRALRERHTQIVRDVSADRDYFAVPWLADTRVEVCIPVLRAGEVLGILDLQSPDPDAFPQDLVSKVESIAPLIGVAIETAGAISALEDSNRQLQLSEAVSRIVVGAANVSDLASRVAIKIREEFGVECVAVFRAQAREGALDLAGCASEPGFGGPLSTQARHGQGLVGRVAQSACALVFDSVVEPTREDALCSESQSELCVPLASTGRVAGVLHLASVVPRRFGPRDAQLLEAAAVPIAHAMASAVAMDRLEQLRNELSSMIVHDLRNPLMVVLTALRVLERVSAVQEDPRCQRYLRNASVAGDELLRMIGSLLDLQKLESGEINLQRTVFSLGDVVQRVVAGSQILAEVEEVDLDAEIASDLPPIKADLDLVLRTVENLVGNAVKFTPSGGRVRARVRRASREELASRSMTAGGGLLVDVVDSGEGIPEEDQERIFEKFGVVESRRRRVKVSTGLGLAMCKLVISAHKGSIWVESRPGAGARFVFILPLE
jgi:signal transduction histidine kinase